MTVGRFVVGLGIGEAAMVAPIYIAEISPVKLRGRLVTIDALTITFGQCLASVLNIGFEHVPNGWRYSLGLGAPPSLILLVLCILIPETTRYLIQKNREVERKVTHILRRFEEEAAILELSLRDPLSMLYCDKANAAALVVENSVADFTVERSFAQLSVAFENPARKDN
ncbi:hypothetical protein V1525DRAFT_459703 [Lipomyces kononenkoae]|uniref:Uncharacterized protein n=1 Tax=Lipomyces kononenkoae TaxID=34357 RepID=A0ACC3SRV1_LIPKO